jgi:hypothetical protein
MGAAPNLTLDPSRLTLAKWYRLSMTSGLLTAVAAGTASAGHCAAVRFTSATGLKFSVVRARFHWETISGFTAAQEVAFAMYKLSSYTAAHTGGNAGVVDPIGHAVASSLTGRIGDTAALTAGTQTIGAQRLRGAFPELAAAAVVQKGFIDEELANSLFPVTVLGHNEGLLFRNEILMGAGGTGRLTVEIDGFERKA